MPRHSRKASGGFTLIELMISMTIGMIVIASVAGTFQAQTRQNKAEEEISQMHQNVRGAIDLISRDLMQAGYEKSGGTLSVTGVTSSTTQLLIQADLDESNAIDSTSTTTLEYIVYAYDSTNKKITRKLGGGTAETVADNITQFDFAYKASDGSATTTSSAIRKLVITITGQTQNADPSYTSNGGKRTYQLSAEVTPPNLAL